VNNESSYTARRGDRRENKSDRTADRGGSSWGLSPGPKITLGPRDRHGEKEMTTIWICFGVCCLTLLGYVLYALHDIGKDDPETSCERDARTTQ
jgi:hypothetical protein